MKRPEWAEEAERMLASGKTGAQVAREIGRSNGVVTMYAGPKWKAYLLRDNGSNQVFEAFDIKAEGGKKPTVEDCNKAVQKFPDLMEVLLSDRKFEQTKQVVNGSIKVGVFIRCHKCNKTQDFYPSNGAAPNPAFVARSFRNKGWAVGGGPRADTCPDCLKGVNGTQQHAVNGHAVYKEGILAAKMREATQRKEDMQHVSPPAKPEMKPVLHDTSAKTLKDIDRQTRRIIDTKLDEVYDLSKGGYQEGWSDKRVAADLGCAVEWIAMVRDFGFGPETTVVDFSRDIAMVKGEFEKMREIKKQLDALVENIEKLDNTFNAKLLEFEKVSRDMQVKYDTFMKKWGSQ